MKKYFIISLVVIIFISFVDAQLVLNADGTGNTYDLITEKLAPGHNPIEVPDCGHEAFGDHIDEIFDNELNSHVFRFHLHVNQDDDRCINFDRQRCEIKAYDKSPDSLIGIQSETIRYSWKFKIDENFQSSPKFTHLHQLKAVGGPEAFMPLITLTTRAGSPDEFELRYAETTSQTTLKETDLSPFKGIWCEVHETVTYGENGNYGIEIKSVSDNHILFSYENNDIRMWKTDAEFIRPKWGIYRSLIDVDFLRDEQVLFSDFVIEEIKMTSTNNQLATKINIIPNPTNGFIQLEGLDIGDKISLFNLGGEILYEDLNISNQNYRLDLTSYIKGIYILKVLKGNEVIIKRVLK